MWVYNVLCGLIVIVFNVYSVQGYSVSTDGSNVLINGSKAFEIPRCRGEYDIALMSFNLSTWIRVQMRIETQNNNDSQTHITRLAFSEVPSHGRFEVTWSSENGSKVMLNNTEFPDPPSEHLYFVPALPGVSVGLQTAVMQLHSGSTLILIKRMPDLSFSSSCTGCNTTGLLGQHNNTMFVFRDGTTIPRNSSKEQIDAFVNSWRIQNPTDSLFTYDDKDFNYYTNDTCPIASTSKTSSSSVHNTTTAGTTSSVHNTTTVGTTSSVHNTTTSQPGHGSTTEGAPESGGGLSLHTITTGYIVSAILITLFLANA